MRQGQRRRQTLFLTLGVENPTDTNILITEWKILFERTDAEAETPILWPLDAKSWLRRLWCWERLKAGEVDNRGWDRWMASPTQWTWVWVNSRSWWWTGRPGVLRSMGLPSWTRLSNWTEPNWTDYILFIHCWWIFRLFSWIHCPAWIWMWDCCYLF